MNIITKGADIRRTELPPPISHPNYDIDDVALIEKVTKKLLHHLDLGQFRGPYTDENKPKYKYRIHTSPIACKTKASGKAMAIINESAPLGASINSEIKPEDKYVIFTSFKQLC